MSSYKPSTERHVPNPRLQAQRLSKNWTQAEVSNWERGAAVPAPSFCEQLCALFGKTPEELGLSTPAQAQQEERVRGSASTMPVPLTSLIGREREVAAACTLLRRAEVRLLTLTGTGGVGKTRLALEIASQMQEDFPDGVCLVWLAPLQDAALVLPAMAQALGLQSFGMQPPLEHLQAFLRDQHRLLVLDNFEHVIAATPLLVDLLLACPHLKLLVTSREVLYVRGERTVAVEPLAFPDPGHLPGAEMISHYGAVALFLERAQEVQPSLELTQDTAPLIAAICRRLDGLPLALELAAARLKVLSLSALLERLEHRLPLLTGGPQDLPLRQQTLRNTLQWSYDLLSQEEQRLFRQLSVFAGGCTLEAVEVLYNMLGGGTAPVLDAVSSLLDKHLLYQTAHGGEEPRLLMLATIREYGWECLSGCGELEQVQHAHASYYLHLAEEADAHPYEQQWLDRLEWEHDNLRTALNWSMEQTGSVGEKEAGQRREIALRLATALERFWSTRGYISEGRTWLERALVDTKSSEEASPLVRANALDRAGWLSLIQGDEDRAEVLYKECLPLYREARETAGTARSLLWLGWCSLKKGNNNQGRSLLQQSRALVRNVGNTVDRSRLLMHLGAIAIDLDEYVEARSWLEESLVLWRETNIREGIAWSLRLLGRVFLAQGDKVRASALFEESLTLSREMNNRTGLAHSLSLLGRCALSQGNATRARSLLEESLGLFTTLGMQPNNTALVLCQLASIATLQGDEAAAHSLYQESLALFRQLDDRAGMACCLQGWGRLVARQGEAMRAARLWGAAERLCDVDSPRGPFLLPVAGTDVERADYERMVSTARAELGEQAWVQALAEGRTMTPEQALAAEGKPALSDRPLAKSPSKPRPNASKGLPPIPPHGLTEREVEVLRLVAQGLTDTQVAQALVISPRTVNAHLRSIYSKLRLTSRHAATRYALEHHLV